MLSVTCRRVESADGEECVPAACGLSHVIVAIATQLGDEASNVSHLKPAVSHGIMAYTVLDGTFMACWLTKAAWHGMALWHGMVRRE